MVPLNHAHPTRRVARARHRAHPPAGAGDVRPRGAGAAGLRRGPHRTATASSPTRSSCATSTSTRRRRRSTGSASSSSSGSSPSACHLRLAYSAIKINLELERVGDYAESVARQLLRLSSLPPPDPIRERIVEMADLAIPMLHDAIEAFVSQDPTLAKGVILVEPAVDALLGKLNTDLLEALPSRSWSSPRCWSRSSTSGGASSGWPTRRATCAWRRSTCARASTPSTPGPRPSGSSSSASTTPAAARWPRRSPSRSASRSSSSRAPGSTRARSTPGPSPS